MLEDQEDREEKGDDDQPAQVPTRKGGPIRSPKNPPTIKEEKKKVVLNGLHVGLSVASCAKLVNVHRVTIYQWADEDEDFKNAMAQEQTAGVRDVAEALMKEALNGNVKAQQFFLVARSDEFANKPTMSENELLLYEKIVSLMMRNRLLPEHTEPNMLIGLN